MALVYLLRHGDPDYGPIRARNWPGAVSDLAPLSPLGISEALEAARQLRSARATAIVSSPMTRALQTASLVASSLGLYLDVDFDLREWLPDDTFSWRSYEDVEVAVDDFERCGGEWPDGQRRGWEPLSDVQERAMGALLRQLAQNSCEAMIAVCHLMVIRALTGEPHVPTGEFRLLELTTVSDRP
jgi:broad specificity phosphatase PhoE